MVTICDVAKFEHEWHAQVRADAVEPDEKDDVIVN